MSACDLAEPLVHAHGARPDSVSVSTASNGEIMDSGTGSVSAVKGGRGLASRQFGKLRAGVRPRPIVDAVQDIGGGQRSAETLFVHSRLCASSAVVAAF
jgi:hypothetical protein